MGLGGRLGASGMDGDYRSLARDPPARRDPGVRGAGFEGFILEISCLNK